MGHEFIHRLHHYFGFFDAPFIRYLPGIKKLIKRYKESSPSQFVAWLGRLSGRLLEKGLAVIYWFAGLYGIVSGPRLIDRIGNALVNSFKRPAKRLLMIGCLFLVIKFLLSWLSLPFLNRLMDVLQEIIGTPMIIIGSICLVPLLLGMWLKSIAGEATEFYQRTAEAQFINLLKEVKLYNSHEDLKVLYRRVICPEIAIRRLEDQDAFEQTTPAPKSTLHNLNHETKQ
jgi:hypothetical protein